MPELPEVEVVRRGIERWATGRRVEDVVVHDARSLRRQDGGTAAFVTALTGRRLATPRRRGKYLWIPLAPAEVHDVGPDPVPADQAEPAAAEEALVIHLGMSGQVLVQAAEALPERHLKITLELGEEPEQPADAQPRDAQPRGERPASGSRRQLRFVDQRIFGGMQIVPLVAADHPSGSLPATVAHIGPDPLESADADQAAEAFFRALRRRRSGLKRALLDQTLQSGIGNIYADEALWRARLHFARRTETITRAEARRLLEAVREVMQDALDAGGTSFDALYVNVNGDSGYFSRSLEVYGRAGADCRRCAQAVVRRTPFMGRSSYWCPCCQPRPRAGRW